MDTFVMFEFILSVVLMVFGVRVIQKHKKIWKDYKKNYKKSENPIVHAMLRPNMVVYKTHIYFIAPFAIGMSVILLIKIFLELL